MHSQLPARAPGIVLGLQQRFTQTHRTRRLGVATLMVIISACSVAGCGGGSRSAPATPSSASSTSANTYRKALERGVATLSSDVRSFASCTISFSPPACRSWAIADRRLIEQFQKMLVRAQVPAGDARDDAALRGLLRRIGTSELSLAKAITAGKGNSSAVQALTAKIKTSTEQLNPILSRLDRGLSLNVPA
jgi:hypothetical protein